MRQLCDFEVDKATDNTYFLYNYSLSNVSLINATTASVLDLVSQLSAQEIDDIAKDATIAPIIASILKDNATNPVQDSSSIGKNLSVGLTRPLNVLWTMTKNCTATCRFCYNASGSHRKEDKTLLHAKCEKIVTAILAARPLLVCMAGGDPLIYEDTFLECAERLKRANIYVNTITNGILINEKNASRIANTFSGIQVSLDGLKDTHDYLRGTKCFTKALNAIRLLSDAEKQVSVNFVPTALNLTEFIALGDELSKYDNVSRFTMGRFVSSATNGALKPNYIDYLKVKEKEAELKKRWKFTLEISPFGYAEELARVREQYKENNLHFVSALIDADGSVEIMDISNHLKNKVVLGNLQEADTLATCWGKAKQLITLDNFKDKTDA